MTVPSTKFREDYAGNGSATSFPYAFRIFKNTDLVVTKTDNSGNDTTLTLGTDYTVTGAGSYNGGAVVLTSALPTSYRLTIERVLAIRQDTDLRNQGEFLAETHEDAFDRLTMIVQRLAGYLGMGQDGTLRTLLLGTGDVDGAGAFRARGNRISGLGNPVDAQDAATKSWSETVLRQWQEDSGAAVRFDLLSPSGASIVNTESGLTVQQQFDMLTSRKAVVTSPQFAGGANGSSYMQDIAAINAAITYAGAGGVVVFPPLPSGAEYKAVGIRPLTGQAWIGYGRENSTITGNGSDVTVWTNRYPETSYPVRNVRFIGLKIKNTGKVALALHGAPDSAVYDCQTEAIGAPSFSQILSVRCKVNGNRFLSSGQTHAAEWLDNCNCTDASANVISGGTAGSGFIVGTTQTLSLDLTCIEVVAKFGGSIASRRVLGIGFTDGEAVTITAVDGTGTGATGTAVVVDGILSSVTITGGGSGYSNGEAVKIANTSGSQSWGGALAAVSAGALIGLTDMSGGRCSGISTKGIYFEQVRRPLELGLQYQLFGIDLSGMFISNSTTSIISTRDNALHIGRVSGLEMSTCFANGSGAESFIEFYDVTNGAGPTPFLETSTLKSKNIVGYANLLTLNAGFTVTGRQNLIYGKNIIQLNSDTAIGEEREYISPLITANVSLAATLAVEPTNGGGIITAIDVIDKNGTVTCTLQVGYSGNASEALNIDPNSLTYNTGYARAVAASDGKTIRPTFGLQIRTIAGGGAGTFRVRIRYRV